MSWFLQLFDAFRNCEERIRLLDADLVRVFAEAKELKREKEANLLTIAALQGELRSAKAIADFFALRTFQRTIFEKLPATPTTETQTPRPVGRDMLMPRERQRLAQQVVDKLNSEAANATPAK